MTIDIARLRELAGKATPGPWDAWDRGIGYEIHTYGVELNRAQKGTFYPRDAEYIAAINPSVIVSLLDRLEAAERIIRQYRGPGYDGAELRDALAAYDRAVAS